MIEMKRSGFKTIKMAWTMRYIGDAFHQPFRIDISQKWSSSFIKD